jgi:hypothetical protein
MLRVRDQALVLHLRYWPDEIRDPAELLPSPVDLTDDELEGTLALIDSTTRARNWRARSSTTSTPMHWRRSSRRSARASPCPRNPNPKRRAAMYSTR